MSQVFISDHAVEKVVGEINKVLDELAQQGPHARVYADLARAIYPAYFRWQSRAQNAGEAQQDMGNAIVNVCGWILAHAVASHPIELQHLLLPRLLEGVGGAFLATSQGGMVPIGETEIQGRA